MAHPDANHQCECIFFLFYFFKIGKFSWDSTKVEFSLTNKKRIRNIIISKSLRGAQSFNKNLNKMDAGKRYYIYFIN